MQSCVCKDIKQLTCRGGDLAVMKVAFLLSGHLFQLEGSQAADQWLPGEGVDGIAVFVLTAGQLENQTEQEQPVPNHHLNYSMLSLLRILTGTYNPIQFLA